MTDDKQQCDMEQEIGYAVAIFGIMIQVVV